MITGIPVQLLSLQANIPLNKFPLVSSIALLHVNLKIHAGPPKEYYNQISFKIDR
jgi:hypothetical protein